MPSRSVNIIDALYGDEVRSSRRGRLLKWFLPRRMRAKVDARKHERRILSLYKERNKILTSGRIVIAIILCFIAALSITSIVYFNTLTRSEQDVFKEAAKIDSLLQRRRNISVNLARTVRDYAVHEEKIFHHVSNTRASLKKSDPSKTKKGGAGESKVAAPPGSTTPTESKATGKKPETGGAINEILAMLEGTSTGDIPLEKTPAGLMAVAESYPDLKLSDNFRRFMEALVDTEKEISDRRMTYSDVVNAYTTRLKTFPGKLFGVVYGFKPFPYFAADADSKRFSPVEY